jgi:hypothetical protein
LQWNKSLDHAEIKANYSNFARFDALKLFDGCSSARNRNSSPGQSSSARRLASSRVGASTVPRAAGLARPGRSGTGAANTIQRIVRLHFLGGHSRRKANRRLTWLTRHVEREWFVNQSPRDPDMRSLITAMHAACQKNGQLLGRWECPASSAAPAAWQCNPHNE